ncbi:uncharacterized protein MELLADRAFT_112154 [Melampsora larici-populina 98AG31]|uniref:Uncharacterized protein n=1 Tax=Melampsora larici-populina (strain 98AG31 / pathotype 3-4-7) TaxID=747676 RepID=F4S5J9_MELLP|nr:uncharacterized protein MELLADRAFT_112154 [Melampsora larici-populina 98AG31]EGG00039.1 hypothetical protein MELLADRAFT_112154 [Melampsora larici-populina 98AG31]
MSHVAVSVSLCKQQICPEFISIVRVSQHNFIASANVFWSCPTFYYSPYSILNVKSYTYLGYLNLGHVKRWLGKQNTKDYKEWWGISSGLTDLLLFHMIPLPLDDSEMQTLVLKMGEPTHHEHNMKPTTPSCVPQTTSAFQQYYPPVTDSQIAQPAPETEISLGGLRSSAGCSLFHEILVAMFRNDCILPLSSARGTRWSRRKLIFIRWHLAVEEWEKESKYCRKISGIKIDDDYPMVFISIGKDLFSDDSFAIFFAKKGRKGRSIKNRPSRWAIAIQKRR